MLWRGGLRISEALSLAEGDLEPGRGAILVRRGKGGKRREVGMDEWGGNLHLRIVIETDGPTAWFASAVVGLQLQGRFRTAR